MSKQRNVNTRTQSSGAQNECSSSNSRNQRPRQKRGKFEKARNRDTAAKEGVVYDDGTNDVSWYANNPALLTAAASIPFSHRAGEFTPLNGYAIPGVFALQWVPSLGNGNAAMTAAYNVYSYVRHANSGSANYDATDLMLYILAADSVFSAIAHLIRVYGLIRTYDQRNKYLPDGLIKACNMDPDDVRENAATFLFRINTLIAKASTIWVPDTMPIIARHFWMNSNVYKDGSSSKAQIYLYTPAAFWKYNALLTEQGGGLEPVTWGYDYDPHGLLSVSTACSIVNQMIDRITDSEDMGIMAGDILKAYGKEHIYAISPITAEYSVVPQESEEVLTQIHNATSAKIPLTKVTQSADGLLSEEGISLAASSMNVQMFYPPIGMVDFYQAETPNPAQVMVATRLHNISITSGHTWVQAGDDYIYQPAYTSYGSERIYRFAIFGFVEDNEGYSATLFNSLYYSGSTAYTKLFLAGLTAFDWAPLVYVSVNTAVASYYNDPKIQYVWGDVENYTFIDHNTKSNMDAVAILSEYGVPTI